MTRWKLGRLKAASTFKAAPTALTVAIVALLSVPVLAQWHGYPTPGVPRTADGKVNLSAPTPKTADGKPDLSGIWLTPRPRFNLAQLLKPGDSVPFTAEGKKVFSQRREQLSKDDPSARCLPTGVTLRPTLATPMKIVQTPSVMVILYESRTQFRQILTDGRPLPKEYDWRAWQGFSVGRWEGDTFVAETGGFNGKAWLDQAGYPGTESMRLIERYHRPDFGHLNVEMIIEDPKMYTRPWSIFADLVLQADTELLEFICEENEKDAEHLVGK